MADSKDRVLWELELRRNVTEPFVGKSVQNFRGVGTIELFTWMRSIGVVVVERFDVKSQSGHHLYTAVEVLLKDGSLCVIQPYTERRKGGLEDCSPLVKDIKELLLCVADKGIWWLLDLMINVAMVQEERKCSTP